MSNNGWPHKQIAVYTYNGVLFVHKMKGNIDTCNNLDELQKHYVKWIKPDTKSHIVQFLLWNIPNRQIHRDRRQIGRCQETEGEGHGVWVLNGHKVLFAGEEKVFKLEGEGCSTALWIY